MSLQQSLTQFRFDLETMQLMLDSNRTNEDVTNELSLLGFTNSLVSLMLDNRRLLNSVLLRLQLYSESNQSESQVRSNLDRLNNNSVNDLVNHLYMGEVDDTMVEDNNLEESETENNENVEVEVTDETVLLNNFFNECITQTSDSTDIVRSSEFYSALSEWWSNENVNLPDKKVLKNYLNDRLGKATKSTWTCVALN